MTDSQRLITGIYAHVIVHRNDDVRNLLVNNGIPVKPNASVIETHAAVRNAVINGNKPVDTGMVSLIKQEAEKIPAPKGSKYSNFWPALIAMFSNDSSGSGSSTGGGGLMGVLGSAVTAPMSIIGLFQGWGSTSNQDSATLQQIAAASAAKQRSTAFLIIGIVVLIGSIIGIGVYLETRKKQ